MNFDSLPAPSPVSLSPPLPLSLSPLSIFPFSPPPLFLSLSLIVILLSHRSSYFFTVSLYRGEITNIPPLQKQNLTVKSLAYH